ncbi:hypothetical protein RYX36_023271 [Vicia faba]
MNRNESELVEQIAKDILQKLDSITSRGLERRINTYTQIAQQKLEKSLQTDNLADMEELITTLYQLAELKLEKASSLNDSSVWGDVMATHEHILQLKQEKWMRTHSANDLESELVEQIAMDMLQKLDSMTSRGLERRINTYTQIAQQKLEKSLRTGNLADMEELITTLYQLAELKLEKASSLNDSSVWGDVMATHEHILQLKQDKWMQGAVQ